MAIAIEEGVTLLAVYDMPTSIAFYRDVLGFEVMQRSTPFTEAKDDYGWALLRAGGVELMLNNMYEDNARPSSLDADRSRVHADTTIYFGCRDVEGAYEFLLSKGVEVSKPKLAYYGLKQIYLKDPDGYTLCFQWRVLDARPVSEVKRCRGRGWTGRNGRSCLRPNLGSIEVA